MNNFINAHPDISFETFFLSVRIFDKYLKTIELKSIQNKDLMIICINSILLAFKYEENDSITIDYVTKYFDLDILKY
jgi:hypothetical protein